MIIKNDHFYEYGVNKEDADVNNLYLERVEKILKFFSLNLNMKIFILSSLKFESKLKNFSYEDNFKTNLKYKENFEIVKKKTLRDYRNYLFNIQYMTINLKNI